MCDLLPAMNWMKIRKAVRALSWARDRRALMYGTAASVEHFACLKQLSTVQTVLDIGANKGQFILEAIKWHPDARIIAFEPQGAERGVMTRVLAGVSGVTVYPFALGCEDSRVPFHISASPDSSSILRQTPLQAQSFPGTRNAAEEEVLVKRLDHVLDRSELIGPLLCKIDVQGYELNVLKGFGDLIDAVDYLIVELSNAPFYEDAPNSADVIAFLAARRFQIFAIYNMYMSGGLCLQADFLFARNR